MLDVHTLDSDSPLYPKKLVGVYGHLALPPLRFSGNIELLSKPSVGFCGSRKASDKGLEVTSEIAELLAQQNVVVTSGYARGVDTRAHMSALAAGGETIIVLPEGMDHFRIKREIAPYWDNDRTLVISQYSDNAVWRADRAMERNKLIVGTSAAAIVIEAGATGGTLDAGMSALRLGVPLFVVVYSENLDSNEGNRMLLESGGAKLGRSKNTMLPNIEGVMSAVRSLSE